METIGGNSVLLVAFDRPDGRLSVSDRSDAVLANWLALLRLWPLGVERFNRLGKETFLGAEKNDEALFAERMGK